MLKYYLVFCFFAFTYYNAQQSVTQNPDLILILIRNHQYDDAEKKLKSAMKNNNSDVEKQFISELQFYNSLNKYFGIYTKKPLKAKLSIKPTNEYVESLQYLNQGFYSLLYEYNNDSFAFSKFQKALEIAQKIKNKPLICEISKAIYAYYTQLINISDRTYKYYDAIYKDNCYDEIEIEIQNLLNFFIRIQIEENNFSKNEISNLETISKNSKIFYNRLYAKKQLALYYELILKDYTKANKYYQESLNKNFQNGRDLYFYYTDLACYADFLNTNKKYREAINILFQVNEKYLGKTVNNNRVFKYSSLSNSYAGLKKFDSAFYYKEKSRVIKNEFEQSKHNSIIEQLNLKKKKKKIMNYEENKYWYALVIFCVFLLALYSYIRWKKEDFRRKKIALEKQSLEVEHTQTIEELEKTKQLVIEDHIVLKNKAKVYLQELSYIKAEDHYLQLFTSKKKEFVRGKITEIISELPPNFVQTHRSYIVNKNLITSISKNSIFLEGKIEIPLSRNFKKNIG